MKSLVLHIEYLMHRHDCVILPGIGALVAEYASASIDYEKGLVLPPRRHIALNTSIRHDDGMLATSISRAEGIKFEEARNILSRETVEIRNVLRCTGSYRIGNLGRLIMTSEEDIEFLPHLSPERELKAIGNPAIRILNKETSRFSQNEEIHEKNNSDLTSDSFQQELPPDSYIGILSKRNYYIPVNKIFARCVATLIVIAAIALSFIVPTAMPGNDKEVKASLDPVETLVAKKADISRIECSKPESIADPEKTPTTENSEQPQIVTTPSGFYLIVGTFPNRSEADLFISQREGGHFPLQAVERKGLWRISAGHGDYSTLQAILNSSEFRAAFSEAWIWNADKQ